MDSSIAKDGVALKLGRPKLKVSADISSTAYRPVAVKPLDITVLMGGPSSEREVSLITGSAISDAMERCGHKVTRSDISPIDASALDRKGIDLVFIALHGEFGEDGDVQRLCEARGLRYTGSTPQSSELAMDKAAAKEAFRRAGLRVPAGVVIEEFQPQQEASEIVERFALPLVLKPVDGGSSVDVIIARNRSDRNEGLSRLLDKYGRVLVEQFIDGRELTVGVLGRQVLPIIEIIPDGAFYDYHAKYSDDSKTRYIFDHGLDDAKVAEIEQAALAAFDSLSCRDISRVDFLLDAKGQAWVLEINTIPGFTSHSLLPKSAARIGIGFDELVQRIVDMAMARRVARTK